MNPDDLKHIVEVRKQLERAGRRWPASDRDTNESTQQERKLFMRCPRCNKKNYWKDNENV